MKKYILILILLSTFAQAQAIQRITITDLTGDFTERVVIYQNDSASIRYVQAKNMSEVTPIDISAFHGFSVVVSPKERTIIRDIQSPDFFNYVYRYLWIIVIILFVIALIGIAWRRRKL